MITIRLLINQQISTHSAREDGDGPEKIVHIQIQTISTHSAREDGDKYS